MNYIYSGRLQPLSKLNEREILWICNNIKKDDKVIIGIVNPNPLFIDKDDKASTWTRFREEFNPLTYWERYEIISDFIKRQELTDKISAIVPLPRPSINMKKAVNYLPDDRVMLLSIIRYSEEEDNKELGMTSQGETVKKIPAYTFGKDNTIISPELIFCLMAIENDRWKELVSYDVYTYLKSINIKNRIFAKLTSNEAKNTIKKIYRRTGNDDEKMAIYEIIKNDFPDIPAPKQRNKKYKIGVTFTGKTRSSIVEPVCEKLIERCGFEERELFYDAWHTEEIAGIHADNILKEIYSDNCECIVVFLSDDYKTKHWTNNVEWEAIKTMINTEDEKRILLLNVDSVNIDTIEGLDSKRDIFIDISNENNDQIARRINRFYSKRIEHQ